MRTLILILLATLALAALPASASAADPACVSVEDDVACQFAVSGRGSASGAFLAASGTGEATTYMDYCLEWICPSVAISGYNDARAECHASSVCVAVAGKGHASHEGYGYSVGGCDLLFHVCYPIRAETSLLP